MAKSRAKGARGERQAAALLSELTGRPWRRSASQAQVRTVVEPDVVLCEPEGAWEAAQGPEVKYAASVSLAAAYRQAQGDARGTDRVPWVLAKRVQGPGRVSPWVVCCALRDQALVAGLLGLEMPGDGGWRCGEDVRTEHQPWRAWGSGREVQHWADPVGTMVVAAVDAWVARCGSSG